MFIKKYLWVIFIFIFLFSFVKANEIVCSNELITRLDEYDGKKIIYKGEVIVVMKRGNFAWINVLDNGTAIGIWTSLNIIPKIKFVGDYKHQGDIVEIVGTFHKTCVEHGGDLDIHAEKITILEEGKILKHPISEQKIKIALIFCLLTIITWGLCLWRKKREIS
ncbi:MAG: DNA-binding protein [bacterium]